MRIGFIVGGREYCVSDGSLAFVEEDDGLGMAPLHRWGTRGVLQHGETDQGFRLDARTFILRFGFVTNSRAELYARRMQFLRIFAPGKLLKARFYLDDGETREIEAHYVGGMGLASKDRLNTAQRFTAMFKAPNPVFYDPTQIGLEFSLQSDGVGIPLSVPMPVGESDLNAQHVIAYDGSWQERPFVRVHGPITNFAMHNLETGETLAVKTGVTIGSGEYYEIDPRLDQQTVINQAGVNKIADLSTDSDLATFHLAESEDGQTSRNNTLQVSGSGLTAASKVQLLYYRRFIGL